MGKPRTSPLSPGGLAEFNDLALSGDVYGAPMRFDVKEWSKFVSLPALSWHETEFPPPDVKGIPAKPGVYIFFVVPEIFSLPQASGLMYVGKATSLKSRISSYIGQIDSPWKKTRRPMIWRMVNAWHGYLKYYYTITASAKDAALLEEKMLQSLRPPMNRHIPGEIGKRSRAF